ncbi:MAG: ribosome maturation factor RimM, partial [Marmoricola sp.]
GSDVVVMQPRRATPVQAGTRLGTVADIEHTGAQDLLHLSLPDGRVVLFPFVTALVPTVDVAAGRLVVDDRPGLLAPDVGEERP